MILRACVAGGMLGEEKLVEEAAKPRGEWGKAF